jgi:hypothetical protein
MSQLDNPGIADALGLRASIEAQLADVVPRDYRKLLGDAESRASVIFSALDAALVTRSLLK